MGYRTRDKRHGTWGTVLGDDGTASPHQPGEFRVRSIKVLLVVALTAACGGGGGNSGGSPTTPSGGGDGLTITITASGVSPNPINVAAGSRVTFVNNDSRPHTMNSDQHPDHGECPAIDQVGFIAPGGRGTTGNLVDVRTCRYHDHNLFPNPAYQGSIVVR